jgi:hypothetical protein
MLGQVTCIADGYGMILKNIVPEQNQRTTTVVQLFLIEY